MARIGITYQDVAKAAEKLQSLQKNITVDNVREILGTGSKSTITRLLKEWRAHNEVVYTQSGHKLQAVLLQCELENARLLERNAALREQLTDQQIEKDKLHNLMMHIQANLEHYQKSTQAQREQQTLALEKQRQEYKETIHQLLKELDTAHQKAKDFEILNTDILLQCQKMKGHIAQLEEKLKFFEENTKNLAEEIALLRREKERLFQMMPNSLEASPLAEVVPNL